MLCLYVALSVIKFSEEWFFFTENSRKYKTSDRSNRQTEKGYWHETSKEVPVVNTNDKSKVIGRKRFLVFYKGRASRKEKTNWVMQEYFVPEAEHEVVYHTYILYEFWNINVSVHQVDHFIIKVVLLHVIID